MTLFRFTGVRNGLLSLVKPKKKKKTNVLNLRKMTRLELMELCRKLIREKATK
jgi:hypothetical protein